MIALTIRFLAEVVRAEGTRVACSYCGAVGEALPLGDLVQRIHEVLQAHFELHPQPAHWLHIHVGIRKAGGNGPATRWLMSLPTLQA